MQKDEKQNPSPLTWDMEETQEEFDLKSVALEDWFSLVLFLILAMTLLA